MNTKTFSKFLAKLDETSSRNEMTAILAKLLDRASVEEVGKICYLVLGRLAPLYQPIEFKIAEKSMIKILAHAFSKSEEKIIRLFKKSGDLGNTAFKLTRADKVGSLGVLDLYSRLMIIAQQGGIGSQERKIKLFSELIHQLDPLTNKYLVRIPIASLRLGFSELTILDALSWLKTGNKELRPDLERAYNVSTDIGLVAEIFKRKGLKGIKEIQPKIGIPIRPARAERLSDPGKIMEKLGTFGLEPKYDGFRVQIHFSKTIPEGESSKALLFESQNYFVRFFSRQLEDTTHMFPDLIKSVQKLSVESAILDGEAIGFDPKTGKFLPFQETSQRKRKYDIRETANKVPLRVFVFDLLYLNGKPILKKPFKKRRLLLEKIFSSKAINNDQLIKLTPQKIVTNEEQVNRYFKKYIGQGLEGILCKKLNSPYRAGARDFTWVKYKRAMASKLTDTIDCLVLGYYRGKGKRSNFGIGALLVAIMNEEEGNFLTVAKIGTGLSDDQWREIRQKVDQVKSETKPPEYSVPKELTPDVWANPEIVVEVKSDEITKSPIHSSKYALRFPRMKRFRSKRPEDATSLKEIVSLYKTQLKG